MGLMIMSEVSGSSLRSIIIEEVKNTIKRGLWGLLMPGGISV